MKTKNRSHRIGSIILASILTICTMQTPLIAAESAVGQTAVEKHLVEETPSVEVVTEDAGAMETGDDDTIASDAAMAAEIASEEIIEEEAIDTEDLTDEDDLTAEQGESHASEEGSRINDEAVSFQVILDANGGYFENEWDDVLLAWIERTDIIHKAVPEGESLFVIPKMDSAQEEPGAFFLGWSLEQDGEIIADSGTAYYPLQSCTLYAIWDYIETESPDDFNGKEDPAAFEEESVQSTQGENSEQPGQTEEENQADADETDIVNSDDEGDAGYESNDDGIAGEESVVTEDEQIDETVSTESAFADANIPDDAEYWCGHYYKAFDESLTPSAAAAKCESMGGYLATATTQTEYDLIWSLISAKSKGKPAYQLMGIRKGADGWYWDDGEEFCFQSWAGFDSKWGGDGWHTLGAGCLGWSDEEIKEAIPYGWTPIYESGWNGWGWGLYLGEGNSASEHNIALCNGTLSFTRYANWGGRSSVYAVGGMVEYNETNVVTGYVCEWGEPVSLKSEHVFLNGQLKGNESPVKYIYDGYSKQPGSIKVYYDNVELSLNQDYTYEVKSRSTVGIARVNVTGINRYQGLAVKYYYVVPPKPNGVGLMQDVDHRSITFSWSDVEDAKGYLIQYSTNDNFQWDVITVKPEDINGCEYTTPPLHGKTTYYFRVCAIGDLNDENCVSDWSPVISKTTVSGLWLTIFSNQKTDVGHAFLNVENCTDENVFIGPFELAAGDNAYVAGRGVVFESITDCPVKESRGGTFINFESAVEKEKGKTIYKDFAWYTVSIDEEDLETLYSCMKDYGTYGLITNNCTHFASKTWNAIVEEQYKVCETGLPSVLKQYIIDVLKGKTATELRIDNKDITDIYVMDSNGHLMPYTLHNETYFNGINSLKVTDFTSTSVTLEWSSPAIKYIDGTYNITNLYVKYTNDGKSYKTISAEADSTEITIDGLTPDTKYSFKLYGVSDHRDTKTGIVTGIEGTVKCEATTKREVPVAGVNIDKTSVNLSTASTIQLTAAPFPSDATNQTITWESSDPSVATVDQTGLVKAKKYGTTIITAKSANGKTATCKVQTRFYDVNNSGKSYYTPVYWAVDKGITVCTVTFRPEDPVTRGEFVAFLWRLAGKPKSSAKVNFKDVTASTKFYDAIRWAVGKGIIKGYSDGTFKSENPVTRGETATMIWRYAGKPAPKTKKSPFSDIKASAADSYKAILWGSERGIIKGSNGKFLKNDGCTRGQVVTFLYRYKQKY